MPSLPVRASSEVQPAECRCRSDRDAATSRWNVLDAQSNRHGWLARGEADCTEIRPARQKPAALCNLRCAEPAGASHTTAQDNRQVAMTRIETDNRNRSIKIDVLAVLWAGLLIALSLHAPHLN